jgi:hypothetical protein
MITLTPEQAKTLILELEEANSLDYQVTDNWSTTSSETYKQWQSELSQRCIARYALIDILQDQL